MDYDDKTDLLSDMLTGGDVDAAGIATLDPDGDVTLHIYVDDASRDRERLRHEVFKSLTHAVGKRLNPIAVMVGGGPEWLDSFPPESIPRSEQPSLDEVESTPEPVIDAVRESDAHLGVLLADHTVQWDEPEGARYSDGLAARDDDESLAEPILEAVGRFVCR